MAGMRATGSACNRLRYHPLRPLLSASLLLVWLAYPATLLAAEPEQWLERMHAALEELDYQGEFSYFHGGELASLSLAHAVVDGVRHERLVHLNGRPREVVRSGDRVTCVIERDDRLFDLEGSVAATPFARFHGGTFKPAVDGSGLPSGYRASFGGEDRIAGRAAVQVRIDPKDGDRYGFRFWLDRDTALLLRSELLDTSGKPLEIFQFVRIDIGGDIDPSQLEPSAGEGLVQHELTLAQPQQAGGLRALLETEASPDEGQPQWEAGWLPEGFSMTAADLRTLPTQAESVASLVYSDGLASFSVFVQPARGDFSPAHVERRGATVAVMRPVAADTPEPWWVTVVGEVPEDIAERVARHIQPLATTQP